MVPRGRCRCLPAPGAAATEVTYRSGGFTAPPASPAGALPPPCPPFTPTAPGGTRSAGLRPPPCPAERPACLPRPDPSPAAPRTRAPPRLSAGAGDRGRAAGREEGAARSSRCCSPGKTPRRKEGNPPGALVVAAPADPAGRSCCSFAKGSPGVRRLAVLLYI